MRVGILGSGLMGGKFGTIFARKARGGLMFHIVTITRTSLVGRSTNLCARAILSI